MNQNAAFPAPDGHQLLSLLHRPPTVDTTEPWLLVLMHGVGSNEDDLFGLADFVPAPFHVLSLRAPFVLGPGSYAWFEFSIEADGSRRIDAAQEARSREAVVRTVQAARELGMLVMLLSFIQLLRKPPAGLPASAMAGTTAVAGTTTSVSP